MWRTCSKCDGSFFRGGVSISSYCPDCKYKRKKKAHAFIEKKRTYKTEATVSKGNVIGEKVLGPSIDCGFCGESFIGRSKVQKYCFPCGNERKSGRQNPFDCAVCGEKFWGDYRQKHLFCSIECKQMLRQHLDCIFCGEWIDAERSLSTMYCEGTGCKEGWKRVLHMREERDGRGQMYTPKTRVDILRKAGARFSILQEFMEAEE